MAYNMIPVYPREKLDIPYWINYEVNGDIERNIKKRMRGCEREGIWDLLWEPSPRSRDREEGKGRKGRKRARIESDEDENDEKWMGVIGVVSPYLGKGPGRKRW